MCHSNGGPDVAGGGSSCGTRDLWESPRIEPSGEGTVNAGSVLSAPKRGFRFDSRKTLWQTPLSQFDW